MVDFACSHTFTGQRFIPHTLFFVVVVKDYIDRVLLRLALAKTDEEICSHLSSSLVAVIALYASESAREKVIEVLTHVNKVRRHDNIK